MLHISESEKSITKLRYVVNIPSLEQLTFEEVTPMGFGFWAIKKGTEVPFCFRYAIS
jgi:hypothetical protein